MRVKDITLFLEQLAPLPLQEDYDNAGLITGTTEQEISRVLVSLDCTEEVVEEAIREKAGMIISHHPIVFKGLRKLNGKNYVERTVIKAIRNNIALYAIHTNLDHVVEGVNARICLELGIQNPVILSPKKNLIKRLITFCPFEKAEEVRNALFEAGAGHIGNYSECSFNTPGFGTFRGGENTNPYVGEKGERHREDEVKIETVYPFYLESQVLSALFRAHPYEEAAYDILSLENGYRQIGSGMIGELKEEMKALDFMYFVKKQMDASCIRHTELCKETVKKVAVCGGSGSFLLPEAISQGADVFISADFKYHQFFDADHKIIIADIGHYESEQFTTALLVEKMQNKFPTFAVLSSKLNTNPINYLI